MQTPMNDYPDQFTGWKPGHMVFYADTADVDTIRRMSKQGEAIDLRQPKKKWAATCSDLWLAVTLGL